MSCSVHDVIRLERRSIPAVAVATRPFVDEAIEQAETLGLPGISVVYVPHPVQLLETAELRAIADEAFPAIADALVA